jgi:hypothetical protein
MTRRFLQQAHSFVLSASIFGLAVGCASNDPLAQHSTNRVAKSVAALTQEYNPRESDAMYLQMAAIDPDFSGLWYDASRHGMIAATVKGSNDTLIVRAVKQVLASNPVLNRVPVVATVSAQYPFTLLFEWRSQMRSEMVAGHIHTLGVDVVSNRVLVGAGDASKAASARDGAARYGIPAAALNVQTGSGARLTTTRLSDKVRAIQGGFKVVWVDTVAGVPTTAYCTHGGNVYAPSNHRGFVTAAHCETAGGGTLGAQFYQVTYPTDVIGFTHINPAFFSCSAGPTCRYTDVQHVEYYGSCQVSGNDCNGIPFIVITSRVGDSSHAGSDTLGAYLNTGHNVASLIAGWPIVKTGYASGSTGGLITQTCIDVKPLNSPNVYLCQSEAMSRVFGGDSGSPVFWTDSSVTPHVNYVVGVVFASDSTSHRVRYSTWGAISSELGITY